MKIIVIAAGSGKRIGEKTKDLPKYLLNVNGKTIQQHQLSVFKKFSYDEIIVITGPHKEKFTSNECIYVEDMRYHDHDVLGSLMEARKYISGDVLIVYSDIIFDDKILSQVIEAEVEIGIAVDLDWEGKYNGRTEHPKTEADNVLLDDQKNIKKIKKNISKDSESIIGEFIGIMKLSAKGSKIFVDKYVELEKINPKNFHNSTSFEKAYLTDMLQELIDNKIQVTPIFINGKWCEIDTMQDLNIASQLFN